MNYYQHHIGDYRRDTSHLSLLEHGAYRQLLDMYYLSEEKIPKETEVVMRRLCARTEEERTAVETVLKEFFIFKDGYVHKRCDIEIKEYKSKADRARQNGKLGGRPSKTKEVISGLSNETEEKANHKPLTINQEPLTNIKNNNGDKSPEFSEGFLQAWELYPKRSGNSKKDSYKQWKARLRSGCTENEMIEGVKRYSNYVYAMRTEQQFIKQSQTFFGVGEHFKTQWVATQGKQSAHSGFNNIDYSAGVNEDGSF